MDTADRKSCNRKRLPSVEGLEGRQLMSGASAATPDVVMVSATTTDSRGVTVTYDVEGAAAGKPIQFQVFRSADPRLEAGDMLSGSAQVLPPVPGQGGGTLDSRGQPATDPGAHTVTLALAGGLPPNPMHPYVVVAAESAADLAQAQPPAPSTAAFRKYVIGVVTHGGKQPTSWSKAGPPWERRMAAQLKADGYDAVIAYNWVSQSNHAGAAVQQGPRVAARVVQTAAQFPQGDPVDVHFIGHSEGAVVNSEAILRLNQSGWPADLKAGYLKVTMLDPHAANNAIKAQQYSVSGGLLGWVARQEINAFQSKAKDPLPVVPANVQDAEVFYQHTPVRLTYGSNSGIYNLWGQVPVKGDAHYYDLTAPGVSHSGRFGVQDWYRLNVVPSLGNGDPMVAAAAVHGAQVTGPSASAVDPSSAASRGPRQKVEYAGSAAPGTIVRLFAATPSQSTLTRIGRARVSPDGLWRVSTRPMLPGAYRVLASTTAPHARGPWNRPLSYHPTAWLGPLTVVGNGGMA